MAGEASGGNEAQEHMQMIDQLQKLFVQQPVAIAHPYTGTEAIVAGTVQPDDDRYGDDKIWSVVVRNYYADGTPKCEVQIGYGHLTLGKLQTWATEYDMSDAATGTGTLETDRRLRRLLDTATFTQNAAYDVADKLNMRSGSELSVFDIVVYDPELKDLYKQRRREYFHSKQSGSLVLRGLRTVFPFLRRETPND
jgi:hypothetical protein